MFQNDPKRQGLYGPSVGRVKDSALHKSKLQPQRPLFTKDKANVLSSLAFIYLDGPAKRQLTDSIPNEPFILLVASDPFSVITDPSSPADLTLAFNNSRGPKALKHHDKILLAA